MGFNLTELMHAKEKGEEYKPITVQRGRKRNLDQNYRPKHIDNKLEQLTHKVVYAGLYYTKEGIRFLNIYEHGDKEFSFIAKVFDVEYEVLNEETFDSIEEAKQCVAELFEDSNIEDSPLLQVIKDVMKKINQSTDEMLFVFKLLTDPNERSKYLSNKEIQLEDDEPKPRGYNLKRKVSVARSNKPKRGRPRKQFSLDSLMDKKDKKVGNSIQDRIKGLKLMPNDEIEEDFLE